jgi:hypothetical protein
VPSWSPDGTKVVFARGYTTSNGSHHSGLFVVDANGANVTQLTSGGETTPAWQPTPPFALPPASISVSVATPVGAGAQFTITAVARDQFGARLAGYNAPATWSDLSGQLSPSAPVDFTGGISKTTATIPIPFKGDKITLTSLGVTGTSRVFGVYGPIAKILVQKSGAVYAGTPFTLKATAFDSVGNTLTNYNAPATWADDSTTLSPSTPSNFVKGISTTQATVGVPYRAERIRVTSGGITGLLGPFPVYGPLASIAVVVPSSVTHSVPFTVTAYARDSAGNTIPYNASATWSSDNGGLSPAAPNAFSKGVSTTTATQAFGPSTNRVTVTSAGITGQSPFFTVL